MMTPSEYLICNCVLDGSSDDSTLVEYEVDDALLQLLDMGADNQLPAFRLLKFVYGLEKETGKVDEAEEKFGWFIQWRKEAGLIEPRMQSEMFLGTEELGHRCYHFTEFCGAARTLRAVKEDEWPLLAATSVPDSRFTDGAQAQLVQAYAKRMLAK